MKILYNIIISAMMLVGCCQVALAGDLEQAIDLARQAQVSSTDLDKMLAAGYQRNTDPKVMAGYVRMISRAGQEGLPTGPLASKVVEGLAKRAPAPAINRAVGRKMDQYRFVRQGLEHTYARFGQNGRPTDLDMEMLADTLAMGVTEDELTAFLDQASATDPDNLVRSAMFMAAMKQSGITAADSMEIALKGMRNGRIKGHGWEMARLVKTAGRKGARGRELADRAGQMVDGRCSMGDFQRGFGIRQSDLASGPQMTGQPGARSGKGAHGKGLGTAAGGGSGGLGTATGNMGGSGGSGHGGGHGGGSGGGGHGGGGHGGGGRQ